MMFFFVLSTIRLYYEYFTYFNVLNYCCYCFTINLQLTRGFCVEDLEYFEIKQHPMDALCDVRNIMWEEYEAARIAEGMGTSECAFYKKPCQEKLSKLHKIMVKVDKEVLLKILDEVEAEIEPKYESGITFEMADSIKSRLKPIVTTFSNKCNKYSTFMDKIRNIFN